MRGGGSVVAGTDPGVLLLPVLLLWCPSWWSTLGLADSRKRWVLGDAGSVHTAVLEGLVTPYPPCARFALMQCHYMRSMGKSCCSSFSCTGCCCPVGVGVSPCFSSRPCCACGATQQPAACSSASQLQAMYGSTLDACVLAAGMLGRVLAWAVADGLTPVMRAACRVTSRGRLHCCRCCRLPR